jgi:hypothetical protein
VRLPPRGARRSREPGLGARALSVCLSVRRCEPPSPFVKWVGLEEGPAVAGAACAAPCPPSVLDPLSISQPRLGDTHVHFTCFQL